MAIESNVADRRLHDGSRTVEQDNIIRMFRGDIRGTGCAEWGDANAHSSIIICLSVCGFHEDSARGRLRVNTN